MSGHGAKASDTISRQLCDFARDNARRELDPETRALYVAIRHEARELARWDESKRKSWYLLLRSTRLCFTVAGALLLWAHSASAEVQAERTQGAQSPSEGQAASRVERSKIVMPHVLEAHVSYPNGTTGNARVIVELLVQRDGSVEHATIVEGTSPFTEVVLEAAPRFRFAPATLDGKAVPARIRYVVQFSQVKKSPESVMVTDAKKSESRAARTVTETPASAGGVESHAEPSEILVTVLGQHPEVTTASMGRADVEQLPGAFGDPFRAIEALPGVVPMVSGVPFFYIRGAPPGNQGYFIDGIRVPLLYHMAMGPGIVHPALVDRLDLFAGAYPAQYGRFAGAVVAAESRDPPPEYHAQGSVRLVDSGAYATAPFLRGSVALGGRYSYTAAVISLIAPDVKLDYWDYQIKIAQHVTDKDSFRVFALGSLDLVKAGDSDTPGSLAGTEFHRIDARYQRRMGSRTRLMAASTIGYDKTLAAETVAVRDRLMASRIVLEHEWSPRASMRCGADAGFDSYDVIVPVPEKKNARLVSALPKRNDTVAGFWTDLRWNPTRDVLVVPGVRVDHYRSQGTSQVGIEPRVSAVYSLRQYLRLVHALGVAHQPPSFVVPIPGFQLSGLKDGLQRSLQSSASVEWDIGKQLNFKGTLFQNAFFNLTDQLSLLAADSDMDAIDQRSRGSTYGLELSLRRSFSQRVGGFLSYTLSKSWRTLNGVRFPASFDRRHVLQAALAFDLGRNWRASSRFVFYSGIPSQFGSDEYVPGQAAPIVGHRSNENLPRTPLYYRVDARLQKRWPIGRNGAYWAFTVEALNATLNREVVYQECSYGKCDASKIGPITIPSLGLEAAY